MKLRYAFLVSMIVCIMGCGPIKETVNTVESESKENIQIGMTFDTFVVERWQRDRDVFVSTAKELGAEVIVQNANGDVQKQISQIEYFIEKKVDVIVIVPIDATSLGPSIKKAKDVGIKIISYDRLVLNADIDCYISFNNYEIGYLMGRAVNSQCAKEDGIIMVCGPLTDENVPQVVNGFEDAIKEKELNILDKVYIDGWKAELAAEYVRSNIESIKDAKAIMCGNDNFASYVLQALAENRLAGDIIVVGQDADLEACQNIVEEKQYMTVFKSVDLLAKQAAQLAYQLALDGEIEYVDTIDNGMREVPCIYLDPITVKKNNLDEVIIKS